MQHDLMSLVGFNKKFNSTDKIEHADILTILQQGVLLKGFRTLARNIFPDEQVFRLQDSEILSGKITAGSEQYRTGGVLQKLLPTTLAYSPSTQMLDMLADWFAICKDVKHCHYNIDVKPKHIMVISGAIGTLQRSVYGIKMDSIYLYIVNKSVMILIDDESDCVSVMSMQNIFGNWIADRALSDHTTRTPSIVYLAHRRLRYNNIGAYLAVQDYSLLEKGDQAYLPQADYDHGMYVNEQMTHREWLVIKKRYCFDIVDGKVLSLAQIAEQTRAKQHETQATTTPYPTSVKSAFMA